MPDRPALTNRTQARPGIQILLFHAALWFAPVSFADQLTLSPTVNFKETYNDNVYLSQSGSTSPAWITEVTPGIGVVANGPSYKLKLNYAIQELNYSGQAHSEQTNQMLSANSTEELIKDLFYFENSAHISQQNYSAFAPQTPGNQTLSGNRYEVRTYDLEPYVQSNFGQTASGEIRFVHNYIDTTNGGIIDSVSNTVSTLLKSGPSFKIVDWSLQYSDQKISYKSQKDLEMQNTVFSTGYHLSTALALTGSVGYEKNNYLTQDGQTPEGEDWSLGFKWTPGERTTLSASFGRHYYGNTYTLIANERTYATVWNLGYNDGLMTSRGQFLVPTSVSTSDFLNALWLSSIPDNTQRQQAIDAFMQNTGLPGTLTAPVNTITEEVFLQKYLQGSVAFSGLRNTVIFSLFNIRRDIQSLSVALPGTNPNELNNTRQTGANIMWNHNFTPRTNAVLMESRSKNISDSANISFTSNVVTASLNHDWDPKLRGTLEYQNIRSNSNFATGSTRDNLLSVLLVLKF